MASTTWDADWDYYGTADHVVIPFTLLHDASLRY